MRSISRLMLIIFSGFILFSCSNLQEPIPTNSEALLSVHPSGWLDKNSSDFHGILFARPNGTWQIASDAIVQITPAASPIVPASHVISKPRRIALFAMEELRT